MRSLLIFVLCWSTCWAQTIQVQGAAAQGVTINGNPSAPPLVITTTTLPNANQGTAYTPFTLQASGGIPPYSGWNVASGTMPTGMALAAATGVISGTPTGTGVSSFTVTVHDSVPTTSPAQALAINVIASGGCGPPQYPCARTDFNCPNGVGTSNCTITPPNFGAALTGHNTNYVDPYFGTSGLRITDNGFDTNRNTGQSFVVVASGSTEENLFNTDDSIIWIQYTGTGGYPVNIAVPGTYTGTVNTQNAASGACASNCVAWVSGPTFNFAWSPYGAGGLPITINGVGYTISAVINPQLLSLTTAPGTHSAVSSSVTVATMKSARMFNTGYGTGFGVQGSGSFSRDLIKTGTAAGRCLFYNSTGTQIWQLNLCQTTPPGTTATTDCPTGNPCIFFDYGNTAPFGYTPANCLGASYTQAGWGAFGGVSAYPADVFFSGGFSTTSGQGTGSDIAAYVVGSGCSHLNTNAVPGVSMSVTGDFGSTGTIPISGLTSVPTGKLHNTKQFLGGGTLGLILLEDSSLLTEESGHFFSLDHGTTPWLVIEFEGGTCTPTPCPTGPFFWQVGTLNVYNSVAGAGKGSGHKCEGVNTFINNYGSPFGNFASRSVVSNSFLTTSVSLIPGSTLCYNGASPNNACYPPGSGGVNLFKPTGDEHCGYNDADINDTYPFTDSVVDAGEYFGSYPSAWYGEIRMIQLAADGSGNYGRVYREGQCFSSLEGGSAGSGLFDPAQCTLAISQTGKYTIFTTDGLGTLGDSGGGTAPICCGYPWKASTAVALNYKLYPYSKNPCDMIFQVTVAGTTAATQPVYSTKPCATTSPAVGATLTDGTATIKNLGPITSRADVLLLQLR